MAKLCLSSPDQLWTDVEEYKTGFKSSDYLDDLPEDIEKGETPTQVINSFIQELKQTATFTITLGCM